jgi:outer membrane protein OmpA-like peptidoglycan-associated protein
MIYNREDSYEVPRILETFRSLSTSQFDLTNYIDDYNHDSSTDLGVFNNKIDEYQSSLNKLDLTSHLIKRSKVLFDEVKSTLDLIEKGNLDDLKDFLEQTVELFRGGNGVRHIDFIGYKQEN